MQPRALWIAAHHYELAPSMESGWAHLLQALSTSLGVQADDSTLRRWEYLHHYLVKNMVTKLRNSLICSWALVLILAETCSLVQEELSYNNWLFLQVVFHAYLMAILSMLQGFQVKVKWSTLSLQKKMGLLKQDFKQCLLSTYCLSGALL